MELTLANRAGALLEGSGSVLTHEDDMISETHEAVEKARQLVALARADLQASLKGSSMLAGIVILGAVNDAALLYHKLTEIESAIRRDSEDEKSTPEEA